MLDGAEGPALRLGILLQGQLVRVLLAQVAETRSMLADNTLAAAPKLGLADRFAPLGLDGTQAPLDLGAVGSAQGPLGVALLLHRVELNIGAKAQYRLSRSSL